MMIFTFLQLLSTNFKAFSLISNEWLISSSLSLGQLEAIFAIDASVTFKQLWIHITSKLGQLAAISVIDASVTLKQLLIHKTSKLGHLQMKDMLHVNSKIKLNFIYIVMSYQPKLFLWKVMLHIRSKILNWTKPANQTEPKLLIFRSNMVMSLVQFDKL